MKRYPHLPIITAMLMSTNYGCQTCPSVEALTIRVGLLEQKVSELEKDAGLKQSTPEDLGPCPEGTDCE
jgi:hypothetical protein